ncbi:SpvB/TcaC N-terminal domain-containing protein [Polaromonas sp. LjRoot131]|uniref:SpvB/TcaC N-terminal domain-containing protein n=1 Tax=Polaromonas sp. LjRoot131 TaxID=3342262 RepID=UPI003ECFC893
MQNKYRKLVRCAALWLLGAGLTVAQVQAQTRVAGTAPGQFSVNESGAATYRIPIQVPPGVAGMEPKLELSYNSQGGNGLLGMGWSLGGLSAISRCPRTMAQDGVRGSVKYDMNDRYCMDGQRLILVSGAYGAAGSEYRTELDSFSRITASGTAGNGVASFTVQTKAGLTMEYGNTADSRIEAEGKSSVRVWAINKISDVKTNYMTFSYTEDNGNGEYYPARIDYSGNTAASKSPVNSIQFTTEARPDVATGYLAGRYVASQRRLLNVRAFVGTSLTAVYRARYELSPNTSRSRVTSFDVCDGNDNCFAAKNFAWRGVAQGIAQANNAVLTVLGDWKSQFNVYPGDYNGDGFTDLYLIGNYVSTFCPGPGIASANNCVITVNGDWKSQFDAYPGDYNGDGITDLYLVGTDVSVFCAGPGIASANNCGITVNGDWRSRYNIYPGDYNGDGVTDLYLIGPDVSVFCAGPGIASANNCAVTVNGDWKSRYSVYPGDYNGDGVLDIYLVGYEGSYFCAGPGIASANNCVTTVSGDWRSQFKVYPGDYNGDGVTDLYMMGSDVSVFCAGPGIASANNCGITINGDWKSRFDVYPGDYNGDGITDIYMIGYDVGVFCAGPGITVGNNCIDTVHGDWRSWYSLYPGDYNGDGILDLYLIGAGRSHFAAGASGQPDLLISVSDGTNVNTTIEHKPLTSASVHAKGTGSVYPKRDLQYPQYVVSSIASSNGIGSTVTTQYNYGGLKAEVGTGRGMLGFRWMKSRSLSNNIESYTEFNQNWPLTGSVAKSETRLAGSGNAGVLKRTTNSYAQSAGSATGATFVYPSQSIEESWDLGGSAYPTVTNSYQYGQSPQYGDPTQISVSNSAGAGKTTVNEYWPANTGSGNWILGRLKKASVTSTAP